ncbi:MAG: FliA/WhiG family RNA polymerase sigma factor [Planctomycetes bacterium]|nr:FliA/WhiG family RNA polymerase sigma factor [Planctomycetota bacterium]
MPPKKQRSGVSKKPAKAVKKAAGPKRLEAVKPALPKKSASPPKAAAVKGPTSKDVASKDATKPSPRATVVPCAAALPKPPASSKKGRRPDVETLKTLPTEELWTFYRKAVRVKPIDAEWIETLRNVLMELHYPLVKHIAERLLQTLPKSIELDDLVSAGLFGLMDAIRGFDPDRGIKFKTYCTTRIRGSILDQLRSQDWVPRLVRLKASKIEKALHKLQGEYGREPTHAELAAALEMEHGELATEITGAQAKTMFSLSERWDDRDDDNSVEKVEVLVDKNAIDPIHELNRRDVMNHITRSLTYKERFIIEQYYHVGHTMREIGEMLALTESRVCQIHSNVMARLQSLLNQKSESFQG